MTAAEFFAQWRDGADTIEARTSGSTGAPKVIHLLKADMRISAEATCRFFGITSTSRLHCPLGFDYIAAKMMAVRADISGATLTTEEASSHPMATLTGHYDLVPIVPMQIDGTAMALSRNDLSISNIIIGGAPMSASQEQVARSLDSNVFATYGMTETASHVALRNISAGDKHFTALPGYTFSVDDRGALCVHNRAMSWQRTQTNDIVQLIDDKSFIWLGRADNIINSGGVKVVPEVVEAAAAEAGAEGLFYVTSVADDTLGRRVVLVADTEANIPDDLLERLKRLLPRHHAPREIVRKPVHTTSRGKIVRQK